MGNGDGDGETSRKRVSDVLGVEHSQTMKKKVTKKLSKMQRFN